MLKPEENDLQILIQSIDPTTAKLFSKQLKSLTQNRNPAKLKLYNAIQKKPFDKASFIKNNQLNITKFSYIKFDLLQDLIKHLKINYDEYTDIALQNDLIEYGILLKNGLFIKANRKLKIIKEIALAKCDFDTAYKAQRLGITLNLFSYINKTYNFKEIANELAGYYKLSKNLREYELLNIEVLRIHYQFLDRRAKDRSTMLKYLDHELLQHESKAISVIAKYYFYLTKSLIHLGDNNYQLSKENALLAYQNLIANPSKYRNDSELCSKALNNYLDASLNLSETAPFEAIYPKILEISNKANKKSILAETKFFQHLCSLHLNYLWIKKDYTTFLKYSNQYEENYAKYEPYLSPNFKLEILLGLARMYFELGDLAKADLFCTQIINQKTNPTSTFMACGKLLNIMINVDMGNYRLIPSLINASKYFLKNRARLFEVERLFFNTILKVRHHLSAKQKRLIYKKLYDEMCSEMMNKEEMVIEDKIRITVWLKHKTSGK